MVHSIPMKANKGNVVKYVMIFINLGWLKRSLMQLLLNKSTNVNIGRYIDVSPLYFDFLVVDFFDWPKTCSILKVAGFKRIFALYSLPSFDLRLTSALVMPLVKS